MHDRFNDGWSAAPFNSQPTSAALGSSEIHGCTQVARKQTIRQPLHRPDLQPSPPAQSSSMAIPVAFHVHCAPWLAYALPGSETEHFAANTCPESAPDAPSCGETHGMDDSTPYAMAADQPSNSSSLIGFRPWRTLCVPGQRDQDDQDDLNMAKIAQRASHLTVNPTPVGSSTVPPSVPPCHAPFENRYTGGDRCRRRLMS